MRAIVDVLNGLDVRFTARLAASLAWGWVRRVVRSRWTKRAGATLIVAVIAFCGLVGYGITQAKPAHADVFKCKLSTLSCGFVPGSDGADCWGPVPTVPGGTFTPGKAQPDPTKPGQDGDPFVKGGPRLATVYGLDGFGWHTCDLVADAKDVSGAVKSNTTVPFWNDIADGLMWTSELGNGLMNGTQWYADHPAEYMGAFDKAYQRMVDAIRDGWWLTAIQYTMLIAGIALAAGFLFGRLGLAAGLASVGMVLLTFVGVNAVLTYPTQIAQGSDRYVAGFSSNVTDVVTAGAVKNMPSDQLAVANITDTNNYRNWAAGMFCSGPDSPPAHEFGPALFKAKNLSYAETRKYLAAVKSDGGGVDWLKIQQENGGFTPGPWGKPDSLKMMDAKQQTYSDAMAKLKNKYPVDYQCATGRDWGHRLRAGAAAAAETWMTAPFTLAANALRIAAYMLWRLAPILLLIVAALTVIHVFQRMLWMPVGVMGASVLNSGVFTLGAAVSMLGTTALWDPAAGVPAWVAALCSAIWNLALWHIFKPFRRLTSFVSGRSLGADPFAQATGQLGQHMRDLTSTVTKTATGYLSVKQGTKRGVQQAQPEPVGAIHENPVEPPAPAAPGTGMVHVPGRGWTDQAWGKERGHDHDDEIVIDDAWTAPELEGRKTGNELPTADTYGPERALPAGAWRRGDPDPSEPRVKGPRVWRVAQDGQPSDLDELVEPPARQWVNDGVNPSAPARPPGTEPVRGSVAWSPTHGFVTIEEPVVPPDYPTNIPVSDVDGMRGAK